jgi:hypothetical protein
MGEREIRPTGNTDEMARQYVQKFNDDISVFLHLRYIFLGWMMSEKGKT